MQSGPETLPILREASALQTLRTEMVGKGIGLDRVLVGGSGALESSTEELAENKEPKRLAFSVGMLAIEPSARIRGGKLDLQKLLRTLSAKDQKDFSVRELAALGDFLLTWRSFFLRRWEVQRFLAELNEVWVASEGE